MLIQASEIDENDEDAETIPTSSTIYIEDVNDNKPQFLEDTYEVTIPEDARGQIQDVKITVNDLDYVSFLS